MRRHRSGHRDQAQVVTDARQSRTAEIGQRERRYLVMMGIRVVCFVVTVVLFLNHGGWFTVIPAVGAIALPYFAVIVANTRTQAAEPGLRPYQPRLPDRYASPPDDGRGGSAQGPGR